MRSLFLFVFVGGVVLMALNVARVSDAGTQPGALRSFARSSDMATFQPGSPRQARILEEYRRNGVPPRY